MMQPRPGSFGGLARAAVAVAALSMMVAAFTVIRLSLNAGDQIAILGTANADSTQWALAQTEVEFVSFQLAVEDAVHHVPPDMAEVRRRFDVVYSRITTVRTGAVFRRLLAEPLVRSRLDGVQAFLDRTVPAIDADDGVLHTALPAIEAEAAPIRADLRWLSLEGVRFFSRDAEAHGRRCLAR